MICRCRCNKRWRIHDSQAISKRLRLRESLRSSAPTKLPVVETSEFVGRILAAGATTARAMTASRRSRSKLPQTLDEEEVRNNLFVDASAEAAICLAPQNLSHQAIQMMQRGFGQSTVVTLPTGEVFDTKTITSNANFHARNNRIVGGAAAAPTAAPGMRDRLNPDYSVLTEKFK